MKTKGLLALVRGRLDRMFSSTVKEHDTRLPNMDIGLGVWRGEEGRYYPYARVVAEGRAVLDTFQGQRTLVFLDPSSYVLSSFQLGPDVLAGADDLRWDSDVLRLSNGQYVERSILYDADGTRVAEARPLQVFTRWYGFALTFPDAEIYGEDK